MNVDLLICVVALGVATAFSVARLTPLHPAQLWLVTWFGAVGLYSLRLLPFHDLSRSTTALIAAGSVSFVAGTLLAPRLSSRLTRPTPRALPFDVLRRAALLGLAATSVLLLLFLSQVAARYGLRSAIVSSPEVRNAIQSGATSITIKYVYVALCAVALCGATAARASDRRQRRRWAVAALSAVAATYFSTGRATIVMAGVMALVAYALNRDSVLTRRKLIVAATGVALTAAAVLVVGGQIIGKTFDASGLASIDSAFTDHPAISQLALPYQYASAPIASLEVQVATAAHMDHTDGCATLDWACSALNAVGVDARPYPRIRPFTRDPMRWNTYTALDAPLLDGGIWLVPVALATLGLTMGFLWSLGQSGSTAARVLYAILSPAVLTSSGSNNFTAPYLLGAAALSLILVFIARRATPRGLDRGESRARPSWMRRRRELRRRPAAHHRS
jgi:hypothetical protein